MSILERFKKQQTKERLASIAKPSKDVVAPIEQKADPVKEKRAEKTEKQEASAKASAPRKVSERSSRTLVRPIVTEKALRRESTYVFSVDPTANKQEIKQAIYELYGVHPVNVRVQNHAGKAVRYGRHKGRKKDWKKAIVDLKSGETIQVTQGA